MADIKTWLENANNSPSPHTPNFSSRSVASGDSRPTSSPTSLRQSHPPAEENVHQPRVLMDLSHMNAIDRMGVEYAYATQGILEEEARLAERRYHRQILIARTYELLYLNAQQKVSDVRDKINLAVDVNRGSASTSARDHTTASQPRSHQTSKPRYLLSQLFAFC